MHSFKMVKIYLHTKFRWGISIHCWYKTTSGLGKRTTAISEYYPLFRFWPMCSHRHEILRQPAKFRHNQTIAGGVTTSYRFFKMAHIESKSHFSLHFSDCVCWRRWKCICIPNFDEISQSTDEIKLLPVSENGRPPYWNFLSISILTYVILLQPAKFRHNQAIHGWFISTSYRFLRWRPWNQKSTSEFRFSDGTCLRRWISICLPNFDEIS